MKELEIEFKNLLEEADYIKLKDAFFSTVEATVQQNYYVDTKDLNLKAHKVLLRIRVIDDKKVMTLKVPTDRGVMEFHGEINFAIQEKTAIPASSIPTIITEELKSRGIEVEDVYVYGLLETNRQETEYKNGLLVLDKSRYLDQEDFELEYEVRDYDQGETHFLNLLEHYNIDRKEEITKSERFYNRLSELKKEQ